MSSDPHASAPPIAMAYANAPVGDVFATEAAIATLVRARSWALLATVLLFIIGGLGTLGGLYTFVIIYINRGKVSFQLPPNLIVAVTGLSFGLMLLVAGWLLSRFVAAARRTNAHRRSEDLERAILALSRFFQWIALILVVLLAWPFVGLFIAALLNVWP